MKSKLLPRYLLIKNAQVLDPFAGEQYSGEVFLKNGRIENIGKKIKVDSAETLDAGGKIVTHGFCDIHAHFREPGREDKETLASGARAAIAGGYTQVCVMPNTDPPLDSPESIRFTVEKSEELPVKIHPIGAVTIRQKGKELTEMSAMVREGAIAFSDDGHPIMDSGVLRRALEYALPLDIPVINHAEDLTLKLDGQINEGEWSTKLGLAGIPDVSESSMIARDIQLAHYTKGRLHIPHVSSRKSVDWIRKAKEMGLSVTAEVTPHHLYFTDADLYSYNTNLKVAPPIRTEEDRQALILALKDRTLDCIATDHAPHSIEEKEAPFNWAPNGMIGLESALGVVWKILSKAQFNFVDVIKYFTVKPREIMGLAPNLFTKGTIAQLAIIDHDNEWVFSHQYIHSKSRNTPFIGETLKGKITHVISNRRIFFFV